MSKKCDNTSVAIIVGDRAGKILLIERKKYNPGFALPAGHEDGDGAEAAAKKELFEEVGLNALIMNLVLIKNLKNPCKRDGGNYHVWVVFVAQKWEGEVKKSDEEVKSFIWADEKKVLDLARKLEKFIEENKLSTYDLPALVKATNESEGWKKNPGLEPSMYVLFKELKII